jgi:[ribosomal protein S5]-alanine N-acetyltransferase
MALHHTPPAAPRGPLVTDVPEATSRRAPAAAADWTAGLPVLDGPTLTLRELQPGDAPMLFAMLTRGEAARFVSAPPASIEGVERFIAWTVNERAAGTHACFGIVPHGMSEAIGIVQIRQSDVHFRTAEWGFALGAAYWGRGLFVEAARLALDFAFDVLRVHRLEARAAVRNGRGNGALRKVGAVQEGILRRSFFRDGEYLDQVLWTILAGDRGRASVAASLVH